MPFVVPAIAGALGMGAFGQVVVGAALSFAMGAAARALAPKPTAGTSEMRGMRLSLRLDPNAAREIIVGRAATAGTLVYHHVFGATRNENLHLVFALADCECDALEQVYVDGVPVTWNASDGSVAEYPGCMSIRFYSGAFGQSADQDLVQNSGGRWTSNDAGRGVCYVRVALTHVPELFQSLPKFTFVVRGAKLYDPRYDTSVGGSGAQRWGQPSTYAWTQNPAIVAYNWRRGIWLNGQRVAGMNTPASALPLSAVFAAANACDELVALAAGGTESRYRVGGVISTATSHREVLTDLVTAMAGVEIDSGGQIKPVAGVTQPVVATITDADLMADGEVEIVPKRPRNELVNAVFGSFHDPDSRYAPRALPPRISPDDEAADGVRLEEHYALDLVTSQTQGQRICEILRRRHRNQLRIRCKLRARFAMLEAGDWISWTSDRYGFDAQVFEVNSATFGSDMQVAVALRAISSTVYAWTTADELSMTAPAPVSAGGSTYTTVAGVAVSNITVSGNGGAQRAGLRVTWTPPTDKSVVALKLEYRILGDTVALEKRIEDPSSGQYSWIDGIQGSVVYQVRVKPVTIPERATTWTAWTSAPQASQPVKVDVGVTTETVPPESIDKSKLDPQSRFELGLATEQSSLFDSVSSRVDEAWEAAMAAAAAASSLANRLHKEFGDRAASVYSEQIARASADEVLALAIQQVKTTADGNTATATQLLQSLNGVLARWAVDVDVNGRSVGRIKLDGTAAGSNLDILADKFTVWHPSADGGTQTPVLSLQTVDGQVKLALAGALIANAIRAGTVNAGTLSALSANLGTVTAGLLRSTDNKVRLDLTNGTFEITA